MTTRKAPPPTTATLAELPIAAITIGTQQLRHDQDDDAITELALDIQNKGLLQPIGVTPTPNGRYQLLYGSRRIAAHLHLGRTRITAIIRRGDEQSIKATALAENIHRQQLSLQEEVDAVLHLSTLDTKSPDQIASMLSKSRTWVLRRMAIPGLHPSIQAPLLAGRLSLAAAEEIQLVEDAELRGWLISEASNGALTVASIRATRAAAEQAPEIAKQIAPAVEHAVTQAAHTRYFLECAACHTKREPADLAIVRVCRDGCAENTHTTT